MNHPREKIKLHWIRLGWILFLLLLPVIVASSRIYAGYAAGRSHTRVVSMTPGDWPMYLHDLSHTSYNPFERIIGPSSASSLKPRWIRRVGGDAGVPISTQPVVANGLIYWGSWDGYEHATDISNPTNDVWTTFLGQTANNPYCSPPQVGVASTATVTSLVIGGSWTRVLFLGGGDGTFYALNALTGQKIWSIPFGSTTDGYFLWSSPTFYKGYLYFGVASWGDCPLVQGEFVKVKASTGVVQNVWYPTPTDTPGCIGGGIWSSAAIDRETDTLFLNTGTSGSCLQYGQAVIALNAQDLSLVGAWQPPASEQVSDGDFGASPTLFRAFIGGTFRDMVGEENKNGIYYAFDRTNINAGPVWETQLATSPDNIVSSAWDGTHLLVAADNTTINGVDCEGSLESVDPATGAFLWRDCLMGGKIDGTVTLVRGLAVVGVGSIIYAVATTTTPAGAPGKVLFSFQDTSYNWFYAGTSISNGVMYAPNSDGNFYAFTPNGQ